MKRIAVLMLLGLGSLAQYSPESPWLSWKDVAAQYGSLREIKPILVNDSNRPVFLSRIWPDGFAQLQRLDEATGTWEAGEWGIRCGTVAKATQPITVAPRSEHRIGVYWQLSTDSWESPTKFVVLPSREKRPLAGRYRLMLRYALTPWTLGQYPKQVYTILSPEFMVTK